MHNSTHKTFWDIEKEKTWRIYFVFAFLLLFYFVPIFAIWVVIKFIIHIKQAVYHPHSPFNIFGLDTFFVLFFAAVVSACHWYYSNKNVVGRILKLLGAKHPDKNDRYHYIFENVVDEIETAAGGLKVERYIIPVGAMNAFALSDFRGRNIVGVTEGLLSRFDRQELQAVMAHEMAHIVSKDCLQTTIVCSLFDIYSEALAQFNRSLIKIEPFSVFEKRRESNVMTAGVASLPVIFLLFVTTILGQLLKMFISREKEYRADAAAVRLTRNPLSLARALYKIGVHWRGAGYGGEYLAPIFILRPEFNQLDEEENVFATLFSTHPPLIKRLQVILDMAHSDLAQICRELRKRESPQVDVGPREISLRFLAELDDHWEGPFTIVQLQSLDWLKPTTKLRIENSNEILPAGEIPALNRFFHDRNEPIWKIRRLCPDCREWLVLQEYEGLYVWRCAFCNGIMVEEHKLSRIFVRREKGFSEKVRHTAETLRRNAKKKHPHFNIILKTPHPRSCPKCGKDMVHKFYSYAYHVVVDECPVCKLIWFDVDELEILQCLIEMEEGD